MAKDLSLDYICYLEQKWKGYLRKKYDPWNAQYREKEKEVRATIDDMKNQTEVGIMLYDLFYKQLRKASGESKDYKAYLLNEEKKKQRK